MKESRFFTRGIIVITIFLLCIVVSFFLGKILGNELMSGGKEKLKQFISSSDDGKENEAILDASAGDGPEYSGPTTDRFDVSWATKTDEGTASEGNPVSIEPIDKDSDADKGEEGISSLFGLDSNGDTDKSKQAYRVQVGVFNVKENADKLTTDLKAESYNAYTQRAESMDGVVTWKVYVGPFATREDANKIAEELRARSYEAFVPS